MRALAYIIVRVGHYGPTSVTDVAWNECPVVLEVLRLMSWVVRPGQALCVPPISTPTWPLRCGSRNWPRLWIPSFLTELMLGRRTGSASPPRRYDLVYSIPREAGHTRAGSSVAGCHNPQRRELASSQQHVCMPITSALNSAIKTRAAKGNFSSYEALVEVHSQRSKERFRGLLSPGTTRALPAALEA